MYDVTDLVIAFIGFIMAVLTTFVIPWIKQKIDAEKLAKAKAYAKIGVESAEMIFKEAGRGKDKKEYVKKYLEDKGLTYDAGTIDALIESSVCQLKEEL